MRISIVMGFFLPVPAVAGGATEKIWHRLAELMAEAGHDVTVVSRRWSSLPNRETFGRLTHVRVSGINHTPFLPVNLLLDFFWGLRVAHTLPPADVVVCNTVSLPVWLNRIRPAAGKVAVVLGRMPKGQNRFYGGAQLILATSRAVADQALRENPRLADRLLQFPNPIDWSLHARASIQRQAGRTLQIGYVGRLHPEKGLELLLEAACALVERADLSSWRVVLIGPVSVAQGGGGQAYRDALERRYGQRLGLRLQILPPVFDKAELAHHYGDIDIFCYPSLAAKGEGLSIAPIEAMAAGAVPVVSQLECYRDLIVPGENGYTFDHTKTTAVEDLSRLLGELLANPNLRQRIAARAQSTAHHFDYSETTRLLLARFAELMDNRSSATVSSPS